MKDWRKRLFNIIEPSQKQGDKISEVYDYIMLCTILISLIPLMFIEQTPLLVMLDIMSCCVFICDYFLRWITADIRMSKYGKYSFLLYPFTLKGLVDLLSILPTMNIFNPALKVLRATRFLRIFRFLKFARYYEPIQVIVRVLKRERAVLLAVFSFAVFYIFITALIIYNVEAGSNETSCVVFHNFFEALYWSTCTLTTVGYGDFYPSSNIGRFICMLSSLMGIAIIALPSGAITSAYMDEIKKNRNTKD